MSGGPSGEDVAAIVLVVCAALAALIMLAMAVGL